MTNEWKEEWTRAYVGPFKKEFAKRLAKQLRKKGEDGLKVFRGVRIKKEKVGFAILVKI